MSFRYRQKPDSRGPFPVGGGQAYVEPGMNIQQQLHPFVARPFIYEPILTTSQKLTPAQKEHLDEFRDRESLFEHLASSHGLTFSEEVESGLDPQVRERFAIPPRFYTSTQTLRLRHLQEHVENIEERTRTAPLTQPLTKEQYEAAGVDI